MPFTRSSFVCRFPFPAERCYLRHYCLPPTCMFGFELFFFILATYTVLRMAAAVVFLTPEYSLSKKKKKKRRVLQHQHTGGGCPISAFTRTAIRARTYRRFISRAAIEKPVQPHHKVGDEHGVVTPISDPGAVAHPLRVCI